MTTIFQRQRACVQTLQSLLRQTLRPKKICLFVSEKPYLLDKGIRRYCLDPSLTELTLKYPQIEVDWVENEGPYRKLLPFLKRNWQRPNTVVITCDDDILYKSDFVETAISLWKEKQCCIGFEGCRIDNTFHYNHFSSGKGSQHLWNLPTGVGSILYEPKWFSNKEIFAWKEFPYTDDLWFTAWRISAGIDCYIHSETSLERTFTMKDGQTLWSSYNSTKNSDTLERILHLFVYKGFIQKQESFFSKESQILFQWNRYIQTKILPLLTSELLEGSLWNKHLTREPDMVMFEKQKNLLQVARDLSGTKVCEIGFNAGFSSLLILLSNPSLRLDCFDLGEHKYTVPAFQQLKQDFEDRINLTIGDSLQTMKAVEPGYDFVHVDGGHTEEVAKSDCHQALRILKTGGYLLLDDTNLTAVKKGIEPFLKSFVEIPLYSTSSSYQHTLYQKKAYV